MNTYTQDTIKDGFQDHYTTSFQPFKKKKGGNEECKREQSRKGMHKQEWAKVRDIKRTWEVV